jgi:hypothetical protein
MMDGGMPDSDLLIRKTLADFPKAIGEAADSMMRFFPGLPRDQAREAAMRVVAQGLMFALYWPMTEAYLTPEQMAGLG